MRCPVSIQFIECSQDFLFILNISPNARSKYSLDPCILYVWGKHVHIKKQLSNSDVHSEGSGNSPSPRFQVYLMRLSPTFPQKVDLSLCIILLDGSEEIGFVLVLQLLRDYLGAISGA